VTFESDAERATRRRQRALFDSVADLYDGARVGYPDELIAFVLSSAGVGAGSPVLEVGCGTGQLTRQLVPFGVSLHAIDFGAAMVELARERVGGDVRFEVVSFEEFDAPTHSFDLIVSATAFHWIDPGVRWTRAAELLRPGGWIAVFATREQYDDPLGAALTAAWMARRPADSAWPDVTPLTMAEEIDASGRFEPALERSHVEPRVMSPEHVLAVEQTRATSLSYDAETRASFVRELRAAIGEARAVGLVQHSELTLARVRG
jgi:ubiquinone/menaquinone biosynthesis C-methylase UbiE